VSQSNVDVFLAGVQAINDGDVEAALRDAADDLVFLPLRSAVEGGYRGHAGLRNFVADNAQTFEVFRADYGEVRDLGDQILAIGTIHIRGRGGGVETHIPTAGIASFREGKMTRWEDFGDRQQALEAAGLSE
jgi:ketosteroid isomerase-like protein